MTVNLKILGFKSNAYFSEQSLVFFILARLLWSPDLRSTIMTAVLGGMPAS